jgi:hypothetical protein
MIPPIGPAGKPLFFGYWRIIFERAFSHPLLDAGFDGVDAFDSARPEENGIIAAFSMVR